MTEQMTLCGTLKGHHDWVTQMATTPQFLDMILLQIWDLEGKITVDELKQEVISTSSKAQPPQCTSLAWSADGPTLFAGYTHNPVLADGR
uniref:Uncharacterized protein n=1 Tax=Panthera leo TaxID=9689 RepID=A0A8C9D6F2_PANLE